MKGLCAGDASSRLARGLLYHVGVAWRSGAAWHARRLQGA